VNEHPIHLVVTDDLQRNRLTVFFRLLLAIPHLIWLSIWGVAVVFAVIANWFATLILGRSPAGLHDFLAQYLRYITQVWAYLFLAANPYPDLAGRAGYPVDVVIAPPAPQNRWKVAFRIVLAIPALLISALLASAGFRVGYGNYSTGLLGAVAVLGWFASLARGRMPRGLRDAAVYALSYAAQLDGYLMLLSERYPNSDPVAALGRAPVHAADVSLTVEDDLRRSRLTVFFRLLLALPHLLWLFLWGVVALLATIANWLATLLRGRSPDGLHRFLSAYVRYQAHVYSFLHLIANPFPGFTGAVGSYPVEVTLAPPRAQNRWSVLARIVLAIPAMLIASAYAGLLGGVGLLGWFASMATGQMPRGLRNAGALALRYQMQLSGYLAVLTSDYPYSGPCVSAPAPAPPLDAPAPLPG
jgi:Domain of unknown function (DUF4389)